MFIFTKNIDPIKETEALANLLSQKLQSNLFSIVVYGSAVRGNFDAETSDINILIVLKNVSIPAQLAIKEIIMSNKNNFNMLLIEENLFEQTHELFRSKFQSIARHRKVIRGSDPFANIDDKLPETLMLKQNILNLLMKMSNRFLKLKKNSRALTVFIDKNIAGILTEVSYLLRRQNQLVPIAFIDRLPILETFFEIDLAATKQYLEKKTDSFPVPLESHYAVIEDLQTMLMKSLEHLR